MDSSSFFLSFFQHYLIACRCSAPATHPLSLSDTSNSDGTSITTDEGYDGSSTLSTLSTVIHGACLTLSDHDRIHVFM
jgi:hypothetical protein